MIKVEVSMSKNSGVLDDVLDGIKEVGDKMERGYPGLVFLEMVD